MEFVSRFGRQIVQMLSFLDQTVDLYSGAHASYPDDPNGVYVVGGWRN